MRVKLSRRLVKRGLLAGAFLLLTACGGGDSGGGGEGAAGDSNTFSGGPSGGVLVVMLDGEPDDLNPLTFSSNPAYQAVHLMFRALARRDTTLSGYQPDLAQSWEVRPDSVVVLRLRNDVLWHDGRKVSGDDVKFTIESQMNEVVASPRVADVAAVEEVTVVDSFTVEVKMSRTGAYAVNALLEVVPVPKHLLEGVDPAQMRQAPFSRNPVGNGFFRFGRWEAGQQVILEVNPNMPEGRAALDRVVMRVVPDKNAALTELLAGQGDLLPRIPPEQKEQVENSGTARLVNGPRIRPAWIAWNTTQPPLNDARIRRALLMAIDREALAAGLFGDVGEAALSPIPASLWEHSQGVRPIPFDATGAGTLLDQAGWRDTNADGIRDRNSQPLRIQVDYISAEQVQQDVLVAVQSMVRSVGVDLVPRAYGDGGRGWLDPTPRWSSTPGRFRRRGRTSPLLRIRASIS